MSSERTNKLTQLDFAHVWHPFTQHSEWFRNEPLFIDRAEGCVLEDTEGRQYIDAVGSLWVGVHGHRHPIVDAAVQKQLEHVAHSTFLGLSHPPAVELAEQLVQCTPEGLQRVFFSDSGSTSVEIALKMAFQAQQQRGETRRIRFAALREAYHGDTVGSVSVGGIDLFHKVYRPLLFEAAHLPCPDHYNKERFLADQAIQILEEQGDELAALIVEPLVQGAAGMRMHSPEFLEPVVKRARELGALIIFDEVATGFGRTGSFFATDQLRTKPDFLCLGKGLTNGYLPLAVTMTTEEVFSSFLGSHEHTFFHGHTYTANPLGCAAALATLRVFQQEKTMEKVELLVEKMAQMLRPLASRQDVGLVRQKGLMVGIDLRGRSGEALPQKARTGHRICMAARQHGVILRPLGDTVVMMPPLCITESQLHKVVEVFAHVLDQHKVVAE